MATTVYHAQTPAPEAYNAIAYDQHVILTKDSTGRIVLLNDQYDVVADYEIPMAPFVTILGEIGLSERQAIRDRMAGGYAMIACNRAMEVQ
jgi:hypothetical protein